MIRENEPDYEHKYWGKK